MFTNDAIVWRSSRTLSEFRRIFGFLTQGVALGWDLQTPAALKKGIYDNSISHPETLSRMTPAAILEIEVTAKSSLAVVTSCAGVVAVGEVREGAGRADLSFLRETGSVVMTVGAAEPLTSAVLRVTESQTECRRVS